MTVPVEHCLLIGQFWTTYALSQSAIVCQAFALSLILALVLPFFLSPLHRTPSKAVFLAAVEYEVQLLSMFPSVILRAIARSI